MFVASYNTYIHTSSNDKTSKIKESKEAQTSDSFATRFLNKPALPNTRSYTTPINYLQNPNTFNNKQKLQPDLALKQGLLHANIFNTSITIKNAKTAYTANSTMFSIVPKPKQVSGQVTPTRNPQSAINTYLANDKYYQITA